MKLSMLITTLVFLLINSPIWGSEIEKLCLFIASDLSRNPRALGLEVGAEAYNGDIFSLYGSMMLLGHQHVEEVLSGYKLAIRATTPYRISPYAGMGLFYGYSETEEKADEDNIDNDGDGLVDESGENRTVVNDWMATFYPEIGVHLWVNKEVRFTANYTYNFSSRGRQSDFKTIGLNFSYFFK